MTVDSIKMKSLKLGKYAVSGGAGACIDFLLFTSLTALHPAFYQIINILSFSAGTICTYYLQKNWTFNYQTNKEVVLFSKFLGAVLITYLLNSVILLICIEIIMISPVISKGVQIGISFCWGYSINTLMVFKKNHSDIISSQMVEKKQ